jgi:hypothetical protein
MAEIEAPTEAIAEELHHQAHISRENWISQAALSSAVVAVFAAVAAMVANHDANEAMIDQIKASDQWGYYQAKGIKASMLGTKLEILESLGKPTAAKDKEKLAEYKREQQEIAEVAQENEKSSSESLHRHVVFARSVTLFQLAIATAAISVLARRRRVWLFGMAFGLFGLVFMVQGFLS